LAQRYAGVSPARYTSRTAQEDGVSGCCGGCMQIVVGPDEPQDSAMKRFRREVMSTGLVQEVRRRRYFENSVDAKKRKEKDCRIKTRRDRKFPPRTYSQAVAPEPSPFNDMFGTPDDLFADVLVRSSSLCLVGLKC